jgi:hypothetical protein
VLEEPSQPDDLQGCQRVAGQHDLDTASVGKAAGGVLIGNGASAEFGDNQRHGGMLEVASQERGEAAGFELLLQRGGSIGEQNYLKEGGIKGGDGVG